MKIGVFDSGLGGLFILKAIIKELPEYDYIYLGDTQRVPYGNRSQEIIYRFLEQAVDYLFKQNCALIIVARNTASAEALRKIQQDYLPLHYPKRRVLGMIIPTAEEALEVVLKEKRARRIGILATQATVDSMAYVREIKKIDPQVKVFQSASPLLVPLIEGGAMKWSEPILREYLKPLLKEKVDAIILGCTHYPILKKKIRALAGMPVVSQDEYIPRKVKDYLKRHPEIDARLTRKRMAKFLVTDITKSFGELAREWFGKKIKLVKVKID